MLRINLSTRLRLNFIPGASQIPVGAKVNGWLLTTHFIIFQALAQSLVIPFTVSTH